MVVVRGQSLRPAIALALLTAAGCMAVLALAFPDRFSNMVSRRLHGEIVSLHSLVERGAFDADNALADVRKAADCAVMALRLWPDESPGRELRNIIGATLDGCGPDITGVGIALHDPGSTRARFREYVRRFGGDNLSWLTGDEEWDFLLRLVYRGRKAPAYSTDGQRIEWGAALNPHGNFQKEALLFQINRGIKVGAAEARVVVAMDTKVFAGALREIRREGGDGAFVLPDGLVLFLDDAGMLATAPLSDPSLRLSGFLRYSPDYSGTGERRDEQLGDYRTEIRHDSEALVRRPLREKGWQIAAWTRSTVMAGVNLLPWAFMCLVLSILVFIADFFLPPRDYVASLVAPEDYADGGGEGDSRALELMGRTSLGRALIGMRGRIRHSLARKRIETMARERADSELRVARHIQFSLIPTKFPPNSEWREFDLHSFLSPAREVGGDYHDYFMRDANRIVFVVADVSGKGIPAAIYMAVCRTAFRALARQASQPEELMTRLNDMLVRDNHSGMYVTMACFFVDLPTGRCRFAIGGHPSPLLFRRDTGEERAIDFPRDIFVGLKSGIVYPGGELALKPGDTILLYTDGVVEALDKDGEEFGEGRLRRAFSAHAAAKDCKDVVDGVEGAVRGFAGSREQSDDITLTAFRYWGPGGRRAFRTVSEKMREHS